MQRHGKKHLVMLAALLSLHSIRASAQATPETRPEGQTETTPGAEATPQAPPTSEAQPATPAHETSPAVAAGEAPTTTYDLSLAGGARWLDVSGSRDKLQEYGEIGDGFVLDELLFRSQRPATGDYVRLDIRDARQDDEHYRIEAGRRGLLRASFQFDGVPHRFSGGTFLFGGLGTGRLLIPDVVQEQLQANESVAADRGGAPPAGNPNAPTAGDAEQQRIISGLYGAADRESLRLIRRQMRAEVEVELPVHARAWARVQNENRNGTRVIGTGAYERWQNGAGVAHTIDRFFAMGAELAEPLDYRTLGVAGGVGIQRDTWLADVEYSLTRFRNFEDVLLWDNPFRVTDAAQVGSVERSRFAIGQLVLPPNSLSQDVTASGAVDLPMHGRLAASLSFGMVTQDDDFLPYTRNSAITATDLAGTPVGPASLAALPARDLDGEVRTIASTVSASIRPVQPVTLSAKYRLYRYDGRSSTITFPGYAAFGESAWRREKNDVTAGLDAPVANEVFDYLRHEAELGIDYRLSRMFSLSVEGGWEAWRFDHLRLDELDEYSIGGGFVVRPLRNASLKARYRFSDRTNGGYLQGSTAENPEARGLVNFNWADRRRHLADARLQWAASSLLSLGLLGRFVDEEYGGDTEGGAVFDQFRFGRTDTRRWIGSADVVVTPSERVSLQATYARERREEQMANGAKDDAVKAERSFGAGARDAFVPENYWSSDLEDTVDSLGVSGSVQILPDRLILDAGYNVSFSTIEIDTFNPNPISTDPLAITLENAKAVDWPKIESRLHEVFADLGYRLTPRIRAGVRYVLRSYDLDDFAWDIMQPYMAGISVENTTRFVFADATYDGYTAHAGTVYVNGSF